MADFWLREDNPYVTPGRLPQTMAILDRYRLTPDGWADLISGDKKKGAYWQTIFDEHPEFFRASSKHPGEYALLWRRAGNRRYHRKYARVLT